LAFLFTGIQNIKNRRYQHITENYQKYFS